MNPLWCTVAARAGVSLSAEQDDRLNRYLDLLLAANATMNLTRIVDRAAAEVHHVADALTVLPLLAAGPISLADIGSGGGVPGVPLAIARPDASVFLIESTKKKAAFLQRVVTELGLANARVIDHRAEDVGRSGRREQFDVAVVRAVAAMEWLAEWGLPLIKVGGKLLAMKGKRLAEELPAAGNAIRLCGGGPPVVHPVELPGAENLVIVEVPKLRATPAQFPRAATQAKGRAIHER